jgi:hypothetical protein
MDARKLPVNRRLTNRHQGEEITPELLERLGPSCAVVVRTLPYCSNHGRRYNVVRAVCDNPIRYRLNETP